MRLGIYARAETPVICAVVKWHADGGLNKATETPVGFESVTTAVKPTLVHENFDVARIGEVGELPECRLMNPLAVPSGASGAVPTQVPAGSWYV